MGPSRFRLLLNESFILTFIRLVRTWVVDFGEGFGEVGRWGLSGGQ